LNFSESGRNRSRQPIGGVQTITEHCPKIPGMSARSKLSANRQNTRSKDLNGGYKIWEHERITYSIISFRYYKSSGIVKIVEPAAASRYGIEGIWLFNSYARGEVTSKNDIGFKFDKGIIQDYFMLTGLYCDLEEAFEKKKIC
jgi:predicted nucleotidyltransferase